MIAERRPDMVLVDASLPDDEPWQTLAQIRLIWPQLRCLVLARTAGQEQRARGVAADAVLETGFSGKQLLQTLEAVRRREK